MKLFFLEVVAIILLFASLAQASEGQGVKSPHVDFSKYKGQAARQWLGSRGFTFEGSASNVNSTKLSLSRH